MHGLRTSSVMILDDDDDDALRIQKALALRRIGAILVPGAPDELRPQCPLNGIRVAVLDIDLGQGTDGPSRARYTRSIVDPLIDRDNGPYVAVVWTSNPEDFDLFKNQLQMIQCPPVLIVKLDKTDVLNLDADESATKILNAVEKAVADAPPLGFANFWEQTVRDAANDTLVSLALAEPPQADERKALAFLAALLRSEANRSALKDDVKSMRALLTALNQVHFDKVEERSASIGECEAKFVEPIREAALEEDDKLSPAEQSQLNAPLLFDDRAAGFGPGRLYPIEEIEPLGLEKALPDKVDILSDTVESGHLHRACALPVVFLEVSAACDHQQEKIRTARLLAGVAFADCTFEKGEKKKRVHARSAEYLRTLEPVRITGLGSLSSDDVRIVWNAHFPVSVPVSEIAECKPIGRFREPLLADVRAWLGYQSSRPGYASVR